jgi:AcrR family transcriptional regulator
MTDPNQSIGYLFQVACRESDLDQVDQICQTYPDQVRDEWFVTALRTAARELNRPILEWLSKQDFLIGRRLIHELFAQVCTRDDPDLIPWFLALCPSATILGYAGLALRRCCESKANQSALFLLRDTGIDHSFIALEHAMRAASLAGNIELITAIIDCAPGGIERRFHWVNLSALYAAMKSQIAVLDMLMEQYPDLIAPYLSFTEACMFNQIESVRWIFRQGIIDARYYTDLICSLGHLELFQLLSEHEPDEGDLSRTAYRFTECCSNNPPGCLAIAKMLVERGYQPDEDTLKTAIERSSLMGNLETVKWLVQMQPSELIDPHVYDSSIFVHASLACWMQRRRRQASSILRWLVRITELDYRIRYIEHDQIFWMIDSECKTPVLVEHHSGSFWEIDGAVVSTLFRDATEEQARAALASVARRAKSARSDIRAVE